MSHDGELPARAGVGIRDAAMMMGVPVGTIRTWVLRYHLRAEDGLVDAEALQRWFDSERRDRRRGYRRPENRAANPYAHPDAPPPSWVAARCEICNTVRTTTVSKCTCESSDRTPARQAPRSEIRSRPSEIPTP